MNKKEKPFDGVFGKPSGVRISGNGSTNNLVHGNYIGLDRNGAQIVSNAGCGVTVFTAASATSFPVTPAASASRREPSKSTKK